MNRSPINLNRASDLECCSAGPHSEELVAPNVPNRNRRFSILAPHERLHGCTPAAADAGRPVDRNTYSRSRADGIIEIADLRMDRTRAGAHVALIDDSPELLEVMSELLVDEGHRVSSFASPPPLDLLIDDRPDVIVLDVMFQQEPLGLTYRATVRRCPPLNNVPIVLCTVAQQLVESEVNGSLDPNTSVLVKPFDIAALTEMMWSLSRR